MTCLQYDISALDEALSVDDAVDEDARYLYAALLQAHGQTLQDEKRRNGNNCKHTYSLHSLLAQGAWRFKQTQEEFLNECCAPSPINKACLNF